jgi:hypothetical protein
MRWEPDEDLKPTAGVRAKKTRTTVQAEVAPQRIASVERNFAATGTRVSIGLHAPQYAIWFECVDFFN